MKKWALLGLVLLLVLTSGFGLAEQRELQVATTTKVNGQFFTPLFGNNTSDIDVRAMLFGYSPTVWDNQINFAADDQVVKSITTTALKAGTRYTVTLQQDLTYNDGQTAITAKDYVFSLLLMTSPQMTQLGANSTRYAYIVGYEDYQSGKTESLAGVHLDSEYVFSVDVKKAYLPYFYELSYLDITPYPMSVILPGATVAEGENGAQIVNEQAGNPVFTAETLSATVFAADTGYFSHPMLTSGPYALVSYDAPTGTVRFQRNPYYKGNWEHQKPTVEAVCLTPTYADTMAEDLASSKIDVINKLSDGDMINRLLDRGTAHEVYPRLGYAYLAFRQDAESIFASSKVRKALNYALNQEAFTQAFTKGYGETVYGHYGIGQWEYLAVTGKLTPPDMGVNSLKWPMKNFDKLKRYGYDIAAANKLLQQDGWIYNAEGKRFSPDTDTLRYKKTKTGLVPFVVRFAQSENNPASELIAQQLTEAAAAMHVQIDVVKLSFADMLADYYKQPSEQQYDLYFLATNFRADGDPYASFSTNEAALGSVNTSGYQNKRLMNQAYTMHRTKPMDFAGYLRKWEAFQMTYADQLPTLPLYSNYYYDFHTEALQNYHPDKYNGWPMALLYATLAE